MVELFEDDTEPSRSDLSKLGVYFFVASLFVIGLDSQGMKRIAQVRLLAICN